jgi:hypothetical protein
MPRKKAVRRGRIVPILIAAGIGYLIGSWNATLVRSGEASGAQTAAQTIALRFPQALSDAPVTQAVSYQPAAATKIIERARLALFDPQPMLPASAAPVAAPPAALAAAPAPDAASEPQPQPEQTADISPVPPMQHAPEVAAPIVPTPNDVKSAAKPHPAPEHRQAKRPGYLLSDAQIADIKRRLHLTPDQEQMWPAVAAALRNIGAAGVHEASARGSDAIDPDSPQVADLKSAAIPLLMSFSDEQKDEVRNLAHRMGLDQLASEF